MDHAGESGAVARHATSEPPTSPVERLVFTGSGSEYFRIWLVNLLLSIVTFGLYSAWAKVRKTRYFYDNTQLANASFEYHGNPVAILKGRIIAVAGLAAYNLAAGASPTFALLMFGMLALVGPWLIWKSLQFKLFNSSYRGIRFGFRGSASGAYLHWLLLPALVVASAGLLAPLAHRQIKKFQHEESRYGCAAFSFHASIGRFYKAYLLALLVAIAGIVVIGLAFAGVLGAIAGAGGLRKADASTVAMLSLFMLALYGWLFSMAPIFLAMMQNVVWNHTRLGAHRFESRLRIGRMAFIAMTNLLAVVATLGLFIPFAQVRTIRYRIESMLVVPASSLDDFVSDEQAQASATGEGAADLLDFDLSL